MGTPREVVAGGRVYTVVDDIAIEHRLAFRGRVVDAVPALAIAVPVHVQPLHPLAFAVVRPGPRYLVAVGANPPPVVRIRFSAAGYADKTVALTVPPAGTVTAVKVQLSPLPV
jgi:hypothetical protein